MLVVLHRINMRNIFILVIPVQLMMLQNGRNSETSVLQ